MPASLHLYVFRSYYRLLVIIMTACIRLGALYAPLLTWHLRRFSNHVLNSHGAFAGEHVVELQLPSHATANHGAVIDASLSDLSLAVVCRQRFASILCFRLSLQRSCGTSNTVPLG